MEVLPLGPHPSGGFGGHSIGGTFSSGIRDISALLPLHCLEHHILSLNAHRRISPRGSHTDRDLDRSSAVSAFGFKTLASATSMPLLMFDGTKVLSDVGLDLSRLKSRSMSKIVTRSGYHHCRLLSGCKGLCSRALHPSQASKLDNPNALNHFVRFAFPVIRVLSAASLPR